MKAQVARGMRDFLPADVRKRNYVVNIIREVYESYGYEPIETPAIENLETLLGKYGEEGNQLIFKILKRGEKLRQALGDAENENALADLALRYDLTVPLARVVANYKDKLPKFFKRYQIQPVWRADRPARGRFREFYQCDLDAIGSTSPIVEVEIFSVICDVLERLGFDDFTIRLNHRKLLKELLDACGIVESLQMEALTAIDKLDKIGIEGVKKEFQERGIQKEPSERILSFFEDLQGRENETILQEVEKFIGQKTQSIENLETLLRLAENPRLKLDVSLARGLTYYTGAIMELAVKDLSGSLGGGGRYDCLIGMFGKEQIPACGFSLGLERILVVMEERNLFPEKLQAPLVDVMVTVWDERSITESLKIADFLRREGFKVLVYPEVDKLNKQLKYASQIGVPYVCILGESEIAEGKVSLKNMVNGSQEKLDRNELKSKILR
ncbi:MAG: histidine--tRNA ligase [Pyrinomonadaceae bacterium]|jgi:histidyl-tRNA synthetase|nr:MAG: histidine--tRNA ligase [Pyrinomonadaceae bacterium]